MPRPFTVKVGDRFHRLTVLEIYELDGDTFRRGLFKCDCGNETETIISIVKRGKTKSCGCLIKETARAMGLSGRGRPSKKPIGRKYLAEFRVWVVMRQRCQNPNDRQYPRYGGRGIKVCDRWNESSDAFFADMGPRPTKGHSIDRIDNDGDYTPDNCRWSTRREQANNRRSNVFLEHDGKSQTVSQWAQDIEMRYTTLKERLRRGWPTGEALMRKVARNGPLPRP